VQTIEAALHAAEFDDAQAFTSHLTPDFYMFDAGSRFDAAGIIARIKQIHASGTKIEWHVVDPDVHLEGDVAWVAYTNEGTQRNAAGSTTERKWLESAFLVKKAGAWKVAFWHSTRVEPQR
jgi:ketosteroid isomerase-like protein